MRNIGGTEVDSVNQEEDVPENSKSSAEKMENENGAVPLTVPILLRVPGNKFELTSTEGGTDVIIDSTQKELLVGYGIGSGGAAIIKSKKNGTEADMRGNEMCEAIMIFVLLFDGQTAYGTVYFTCRLCQ
ncbi:unnamed protein product [Sphenostylis stenocarpa]|uniref:Uncharacterized protein n=1 Tax=Sphenostylis stenocarpa TaxID=92480 RepID=A0AA87BBK5_9FABA|nr:unnamed protein product [Sphenostylis stenocarpa]